MFVPIIMAGGSGTRLWPLSRQLHPKQFLPLVDTQFSMLQATIHRLEGLTHASPQLICNEEHRFLAAEQLRQLGLEDINILLEPMGRNTAPAIALAALQATAGGDDPLLLVLAADHLIQDTEAFQDAIRIAAELAGAGKLVSFGITPTRPETGYGYLRQGASVGKGGFEVTRFVEKPDTETAQLYLAGGDYFWNSGMFMFRASRYLEELQTFEPEIVSCCREALAKGQQDMHFTRVDRDAFLRCPDNSIDYAVMEKTLQAVMVPLDANWSDIGSWTALWEAGSRSEDGNLLEGDVISIDTSNSYVYSESRLVSTVGVNDLIVVETKDAVLVAHKDHVQDVKRVVEKLKADARREHISHREVYRPWGMYDAIDSGQRYQVKRITVKPGHKLSVQMHHHRAEHWIVVSGTAKVTNGEKTYLVTENQSTYIPIGGVHALENPGVIPLELIEVQSGSYLGEDDIIRFSDNYGRS
ncbi:MULTISPECIES: mannose-1-phosphate guanylyltransferase/mannose-6-phosphate isomerase [unclassified Pseudomonas]|jgi:mannose-1-phosphate guanylyltransferase|uniref:mannose-1-phosphate guanylyltransferase/mannose-6-phosphate isomerase n=1 Tax=unclassified Pseudomonas TaxID=196821 RepID=UPI0008B6A7A6|nr:MULTISPECIES: mannose-1-phosphate guanylyltransferase/mannose-6-phosphate isomerase [unclassified Pseudomonas]PMV17885.1 mannose-1-phosphate guanylyltransferase/mannose-6-phosphate isomerase [Pseudomonas sp. FW305-3-2-15-C-TSA2]PMV24117.1 mannose-1-phosphate guanylyltransferase/mannose-6-phosphate isomerase [Pseudomonas sp. DP16D-L5]PMV37611.1 mannose-1-phosphate guanylyltransferase/mannose-6-phosphate isomerase [Pseudomonas sp. FW305-3-2-15-A-LB2]PMV42103.1 mannose-1-phosphate guanylyltrans